MLIVGRDFTESQLKKFKDLGATCKGLDSRGRNEQYEIDEEKHGRADLKERVMEIFNERNE